MKIEKPKMRPLTMEPGSAIDNDILIEALTDDAAKWVSEQAPEFGNLRNTTLKHKYELSVYRGYSRDEVLNYLRNLWDSQQWPEEIDKEIEVEK